MAKTILITGSSTGIGRASVKKFQQEGWNVIATMRSPHKEEELNTLENVLVTQLDVQNETTIKSAIEEGISRFGQIDAVLNNAGYGLMGTFESIGKESIQRQFDVNVFGLFDVTRAILPHFRARKSGTIINITSIGGRMTFPLTSLYHATKFAVEGFSESLHYELAPNGIDVKIVEPGGVNTDFGGRSLDFQHDESLTDYNEYVGTVYKTMMDSFTPDTMSSPELIAEVIFHAASDGTKTLRYRAGADAEQLLSARANMEDDEFIGMIKTNFNLN